MTASARDLLREAMVRHREGRLAEADDFYRRSLELEPDNLQALRLCGILARERGDLRASIRLLERAAGIAPGDPAPIGELAISQMASGNLQLAESTFRRALACDPESRRVLANLGALLQRRGHLREAITFHRRYLDLEPDDIGVFCNLSNALMDAGHGQDALEECERALAIAPDHPLILASRGAVLCGLERFELAAETLERAVELNPGDELASVNLAYARAQLHQYESAASILRGAIMIGPDNARAVSDLAGALMRMGQPDEAIVLCEGFLERHPGERLVLASHAFALCGAGRGDEAHQILNFDQLIKTIDFDAAPGRDSLAGFNSELAAFIREHPSIQASPVSKATTHGHQTGELDLGQRPVLSALGRMIDTAVSATIKKLKQDGFSGHPAMAHAADTWMLRVWGVVLGDGGFQKPHLHPLGWLSGVYYVQLPVDMDSVESKAGTLEFGVPPDRLSVPSAPEPCTVEPREGRMVIFPSYFYHRTRPFASGQTRISIAFDVMPKVS